MIVSLEEIKSLHETNEKIDKLAEAYYEEFIVLGEDFEFLGWELIHKSDPNYNHYEWGEDEIYKILITYSYIDYNDERCNDYQLISIKVLNGMIEYNEPNSKIFYNGNKIQ